MTLNLKKILYKICDALAIETMRFKGANPISGTSEDTRTKWASLKSGYWWFSENRMVNQPVQYGMLLNFTNREGSEIEQIFLASTGEIYRRRGSWASDTMGGWLKATTTAI